VLYKAIQQRVLELGPVHAVDLLAHVDLTSKKKSGQGKSGQVRASQDRCGVHVYAARQALTHERLAGAALTVSEELLHRRIALRLALVDGRPVDVAGVESCGVSE
jgi:hypothetical protein